jgi:protein involved in polysaccharide export with SLBB domain
MLGGGIRAWAENGSDSKEGILPSGSNAAMATTNTMEVLDTRRKLITGDKLSYRVVQERTGPCSLTVTDSGELEVPLIGRVKASGYTCKQLAYNIKAILDKEYFYNATVIIGLDSASSQAGFVYVMGQVRQQGEMPIPPQGEFTVSKAILKAGGFADFANRKKVKLIRKTSTSSETTFINVKEILEGTGQQDPVLQGGDVIIVPENMVNF